MQENKYKYYVGIDVSKLKLDIASSENCFIVENTKEGIKKLMQRLKNISQETLIVMEASGGYEQLSLKMLSAGGFSVALANARRVRDYAKSQGILAKTDKIDARVIRRYAMHSELTIYKAVDENSEINQELIGRREQLVKLIIIEKQRLEKASARMKKSIERVLKLLKKELERVEGALKDQISQDSTSKAIIERLCSVPGIGETIATQLYVELPELGKISNKSIAALSGLAPFSHESGMYKGKRRVSGGRFSVRRSLFLAVLTAIRHNKLIKAFYEKLLANGKAKMVAIVACMRKLVVILNVMMKKETLWQS